MTADFEIWLRLGRLLNQIRCMHLKGFQIYHYNRTRQCVECGWVLSDYDLMNLIASQRESIQTLTRQLHAEPDY